eukprot:CAMPEP_0118706190 /NCGR_PEP_ID=MMETSP0800-20121206/20394_1 /TAXON_ID=210618 ORGANISM="Striatella unipunctata, Strain CCMP2910" /NCGR_SAMPLE_ID=MMETSP0800 /ASSEMBLY_ACC=CAM_ASM_000638 /LENGTH=43 /DNA_ID= /DNA_START= /DNA_END= /DNA_ORIENTATION=
MYILSQLCASSSLRDDKNLENAVVRNGDDDDDDDEQQLLLSDE